MERGEANNYKRKSIEDIEIDLEDNFLEYNNYSDNSDEDDIGSRWSAESCSSKSKDLHLKESAEVSTLNLK